LSVISINLEIEPTASGLDLITTAYERLCLTNASLESECSLLSAERRVLVCFCFSKGLSSYQEATLETTIIFGSLHTSD